MAADSIKIDFDSALRPRIVDGVARFHRYQPQIQESYVVTPGGTNPPTPPIMGVRMIPNPEGKAQFVKRIFAETVMGWVTGAEEAADLAAVPKRVRPPIT